MDHIKSISVERDYVLSLVIDDKEYSLDVVKYMNTLEHNDRSRFKKMIETGSFSNFEVCLDTIVWSGWCEIFYRDLMDYLEERN